MTIRPVIFSAEMVRALLAGTKTQTRRLATLPLRKCEPGDLLYVREAWAAELSWDSFPPSEIPQEAALFFSADGAERNNGLGAKFHGKSRPSIHMPRWASRLTLRVTEVRFQTVKEITMDEIYAEGAITDEWIEWREDVQCIAPAGSLIQNERQVFENLWNSLHNKPGERWEDNPQVVALTFEVIHGNVDQLETVAA